MKLVLHGTRSIFILFLLFVLSLNGLHAQVSINDHGAPPDSSAMLEVESNNRGFLMPRLNTVQRLNILNPAEGLLVYDTDSASFWYFHTEWIEISSTQNQAFFGLVADLNSNVHGNNTNLENIQSNAEENTVLGKDAGRRIKEGDENVALGYSSLEKLTNGAGNIAIGALALSKDSLSKYNTAIGYRSLLNLGSSGGNYDEGNIALGNRSGINLTSGDYNVYLGVRAGNTRFGEDESYKLYIESGNSTNDEPLIGGDFYQDRVGINTHMDSLNSGATLQVGGNLSLQNGEDVDEFSSDETLSDSSNTAIPTEAAVKAYVDSHVDNMVSDGLPLIVDETDFNVFHNGSIQDPDNFVGIGVTAIGINAGQYMTHGIANVAIGLSAQNHLEDGLDNTAIGSGSLGFLEYGSENTAIGSASLVRLSNSSTNYDNILGNTGLGSNSGSKLDSGSYNLYLGSFSGPAGKKTESYRLYINSSHEASSTPLIGGDFYQDRVGINTHMDSLNSGATLQVGGNLSLQNGEDVDEFSSDETLSDSSNTAIPTEAAVKAYVDNMVSDGLPLIVDETDFNVFHNRSIQDPDSFVGIGVTAIGINAGQYMTHGIANVAIGLSAQNHLEDGLDNTAIGSGSLGFLEYGSENTAIGSASLIRLRNSSTNYDNILGNTGLGSNSGSKLDSGSYNLYLGSFSGPAGKKTESYRLYINSSHEASSTPLIGGDFYQDRVGINTHMDSLNSGATLQVGGNLSLQNGEDVDEFSSDETLSDSSHTAIPTEAAVKYYVDNSVTSAYQTLSLIEDTLFISGSDHRDFQADLSSLKIMATAGNTNVYSGTGNFASLDENTSTSNTAIGRSAMNAFQSGNHNTAMGRYSLLELENANYNTSMGSSALREAIDAPNQTAMGFSALREHKHGSDNMAVGNEALRRATGGSYNIALGSEAMAFADSGSYNIALGYQSLNSISGADSNIAIGNHALNDLVSGNANIAIGAQALQFAISTSNNIAIGSLSLSSLTTGTANIGIGSQVLSALTTGANNLAIGANSMLTATTASSNTSIGAYSLFSLTSGRQNVALGASSLYSLTDGDHNIAIGASALNAATSASDNIAIGGLSLFSLTTGTNNIAIGKIALTNLSTGIRNIAIGNSSSTHLTTGSNNIGMGQYSLLDATTGSINTALGHYSLSNLTTGTSNIALGYYALHNLNDGDYNIGIGQSAQSKLSSGSNNISLGYQSLDELTTGNDNIAIGVNTLRYAQDDDENIAIGNGAGEDYQKTGSVFIGHNAGADENTYDGTLYIANDNTTTPLIGGLFPDNLQQIPTGRVGINRSLSDLSGANGASFQVNGTASKTTSGSWAGNSDKRLKTNINYMRADSILQQVLAMKGVTYHWNDSVTGYDRPEGIQHGFIAQDLQKVWPSKITEDGQGYLMAAYGDYDPMFVEAIKALYAELQQSKQTNQSLAQELTELKKTNQELVQQLTQVDENHTQRLQVQQQQLNDNKAFMLKMAQQLKKLEQSSTYSAQAK